MPSIHLTPADRQTLLDLYHRTTEPGVRLRAHIAANSAGGSVMSASGDAPVNSATCDWRIGCKRYSA